MWNVQDYRDILHAELGEAFPELVEQLRDLPGGPGAANGHARTEGGANGHGDTMGMKMEE